MSNKFRNSINRRLLKSLFLETSYSDTSQVVYTLKNEDHTVEDGTTYPSLYRLYMSTNDPTEYKFANEHLDGWEHWEELQQCTWFKPYVEKWRKEFEVRMKSEALSRIMSHAKTNAKESFQANKYLLEKGWEPKEGQTRRGRPSKEDIKKAAQEHVDYNSRLSDDFIRIQDFTSGPKVI